VRLDYMPRNVEQIEFQFATAQLFSIEKISKLDGGAMEDWTLESLGGGHYRLTPPVDGDVLPYGAFGDLLRLTFEDVAVASFNLGFSIPYPVYNANTPEKKYFTCPDTLVIDADGAEAPAGPTPLITVTNPASDAGVIDFGDTLTQATLSIRNRGGSHTPTGVWLNWFAAPPDIGLTILPSLGSVANNWEADIVTVTLSRSLPAGVHVGTLTFAFTTGTPQTNGPEIPFSNDIITAEIPYTVTILEPVLEVTSDSFDPDTTTLDFGVSEDPLFIQLRNAGQSTLQWQVIASELPPWLTVSPASGDILQNTTSIVSIDVSHDDLLSGSYNHSFQIISNGGIETVTVEITVP